MSLATLAYITCDVCGDPAQPADTAAEARRIAEAEGYRYESKGVHSDGARIRCRKCQELES